MLVRLTTTSTVVSREGPRTSGKTGTRNADRLSLRERYRYTPAILPDIHAAGARSLALSFALRLVMLFGQSGTPSQTARPRQPDCGGRARAAPGACRATTTPRAGGESSTTRPARSPAYNDPGDYRLVVSLAQLLGSRERRAGRRGGCGHSSASRARQHAWPGELRELPAVPGVACRP
jgi:hypothetical protein